MQQQQPDFLLNTTTAVKFFLTTKTLRFCQQQKYNTFIILSSTIRAIYSNLRSLLRGWQCWLPPSRVSPICFWAFGVVYPFSSIAYHNQQTTNATPPLLPLIKTNKEMRKWNAQHGNSACKYLLLLLTLRWCFFCFWLPTLALHINNKEIVVKQVGNA